MSQAIQEFHHLGKKKQIFNGVHHYQCLQLTYCTDDYNYMQPKTKMGF